MQRFDIITGGTARDILESNREKVLDIVRNTYLHHSAGEAVNPDSHFLRFPGNSDSRIIALPAHLGANVRFAGLKWIASFPENTKSGIPRASAVLILNDYETGYPVACIEAATISSARTAASAALAARALRPGGYGGTRIAVVGAGVIARNIANYLHTAGCTPDSYVVHDLDEFSGNALADHIDQTQGVPVDFTADRAAALEAETIVFATTALQPYVAKPFEAGQLVLNISLRDLEPRVILAAQNILDDVGHCLKASTSPHLAEQASGSRDFVTGTLADVLNNLVTLDPGRPVVFSPFGLGVLDLAVGVFILHEAHESESSLRIPDFFGETERW
ncbi:2,3-diaminopropionate biosynthesis protein SbnB [Streptomyces sp. NBC_01716]|uniref:2,3-diaminopropionate biosynthesis protein SbnB n=1 Tax=Streptomyces sp. NBC_01716 TaxID=2975917 RepID=UPI002E365FAB|nr:2,3-diaminopropionate biosynthesis protein SbnB [Streptomyces sp. NBC_01716]